MEKTVEIVFFVIGFLFILFFAWIGFICQYLWNRSFEKLPVEIRNEYMYCMENAMTSDAVDECNEIISNNCEKP